MNMNTHMHMDTSMDMNLNMDMDTQAQLMKVTRCFDWGENGRANPESRENEHPGQDERQEVQPQQTGMEAKQERMWMMLTRQRAQK